MTIKDRFEEPSYQFFSNIEQFLLKSINSDPYQTEIDALKNYTDDLDIFCITCRNPSPTLRHQQELV